MKKSLALSALTVLTLSASSALAQQNQGSSALPSIPGENPPNSAQKVPAPTGNTREQDMRAIINPLDIIKQKEQKQREVNKTNSWTRPDADKDIEAEKTEISERKEKLQIKKTLEEIQEEQEQERETRLGATTDSPADDNRKREEDDTETSEEDDPDDDDKSSAKKVVANNRDTQDNKPEPKRDDKKPSEKETIQKYKTAIKNIPQPKKPERLWSVD